MRRPGFTFLELLIAASLFVVGMVSVLQVFPVNRRLLVQSANATQAAYLAQEKIEDIRNIPYTSLTTGTYETKAAVSNTGGAEFTQYQRETLINYIDTNYQSSATDTGLKKITVNVYWQEHGVSRTYTLSTFKYTLDAP